MKASVYTDSVSRDDDSTKPLKARLSPRERGLRVSYRVRMLNLAGGAIKLEARAKKVIGHGPSATMVRQLLFWEDKGTHPAGYIWKKKAEKEGEKKEGPPDSWWDECGLTRTEIDTAHRKLEDTGHGVLDIQHGRGNITHYRLKMEPLFDLLFPGEEHPVLDQDEEGQTLNQESSLQDSDGLACRVPEVQLAGFGPSHYREDSKENIKNSPLSPPKRGERQRGRKKGKGGKDYTEAAFGSGKPAATPEAGIRAVEAHEKLSEFAPLLREHDFSSPAVPTGRVWMTLGGDNRERGDNANRLRSVSRRGIKEAREEFPPTPPAEGVIHNEDDLHPDVAAALQEEAARALFGEYASGRGDEDFVVMAVSEAIWKRCGSQTVGVSDIRADIRRAVS